MTRTLPALAVTGALVLGATVALAGPSAAAPSGRTTTSSATDRADRTATTDRVRKTTGPLVIAHRGASGYRPEHTTGAYELAVALGADYIEPDLVMTKDGVLVDRHEPEISGTTDVADHPEFASRRTTKNLDGVATTGWFTEDFTLAELRTLRAKERLPQIRQENTLYDGRYRVPTFEEVLALREKLSKEYGRKIGIIPEIKHSTYFHAKGLNPEAALIKAVRKHRLDTPKAPLWVQSFELTNLVELRTTYGYRANEVFLAGATGAPYDLVSKGDPRTYADLLAPASLKRLSRTIDGIGPDKNLVIGRRADGTLASPTGLVAAAHAAGLKVTPYTFRAENTFLPTDYRVGSDPADFGRAVDEVVEFMKAGVDGVFCDQPDICVTARKDFLGQSE
ncbi:glycerophosphodiester phosphodiesterase [Phycicoccus sp. Root563]|uniref:glycerophosphodiester phosphodiesterase n=1 Tax=unclassified Phycicoccus TaxID=2637926 RepID=UPI000702C728|nr:MULTISPECIES: glycerophosphodiester phosphodiesterase [unclassified Phycicoccus]KQU66317.1 glycerophosphodiester phosphodiesterase [Phycicoccus sp. Root101]KQZ87465.1 glycerophosphodiester phosphodiesterase [Phycicoccus sp. Root563]